MEELVKIDKCKVSLVGLTLNEILTYKEWQGIGVQLQVMHKSCGFWIGDWWNFGLRKYGEEKATAATLEMDYGTFRNYIWVTNAFELSRRRDNLSFSAHMEAANAGEKRFDVLEEAAKNNLSSRDIREKVKEIKKLPTPDLPKNKYQVIYADPCWEYEEHGVSVSKNYGGATRHYQTLSIEELCKLQVENLAAEDCVLFIWVTSPKLNQVWDVIYTWGFEYKTSFIWDKVKHNFGYYNSVRHELLLVCGRGQSTPKIPDLIDSVQTIERSDKHSEKPEEFRKIIETLYPDTKKIELFARRKSKGWDVWGIDENL